MFGEIHNFSGPFLGPRDAQENIFFAQTSPYSANAVVSRARALARQRLHFLRVSRMIIGYLSTGRSWPPYHGDRHAANSSVHRVQTRFL